ncbi:MAG: FtsX-like permease family protein [SAR324 cluster bacterium]|uniref:FtsX-like permease family protein n=1 Tax=SAR324 cluster bacterium TaxID=2024889 RepID=A0A7X9FSY4_9DELT|nr:FtsX-like permease family protein [SAR324 cluster bacterium]
MMLRRTLITALRALRRNLTRAMLTALGIIIGVAAVIAMMEIGTGSSKAIQASIATMGANTMVVLPGTATSSGVSFGGGTAMTLTPEDAEAILRECPAVKSVAPIVRARTQVVYGNKNWIPQTISGTTPSFLVVRDWTEMNEGEIFSDRDVRNANKVAVIGKTIARELFEGESPIGKEVRIQNVAFRIVGVLSPKGANMMGMDQDDTVLAPWTTIKYRIAGSTSTTTNQSSSSTSSSASSSTVNSLSDLYPASNVNFYPGTSSTQSANAPTPVRFTNIDQILIAARSASDVDPAIQQITALLRERHRIRSGEVDDFNIRDMAEVTKTLTSTTAMITKLLLSVALISLVVGGVGIMNIMLVSVTERTREIGLRMAVGARPRDILRQFLVEALVLCVSGGILGILLGRACSMLVKIFLRWPIGISLPAIFAAFLVSASVGIIFGYYPAWKASKLDPIEALRYE